MMPDITYLGLAAGTLTSVAAVPQVVKSLRTRHMDDISLLQPLLLSLGVALWLIYGILIGNTPLVVSNVVPLACNVILVVLKVNYRSNPTRNTEH